MEETRKIKQEKARVEKERRVYKDKLKAARKKIDELEGQHWEGGDTLIMGGTQQLNFKKGKIEIDEYEQLY